MATLSSLVVSITGDSSALARALQGAGASVKKFEDDTGKSSRNIGGMLGGFGRAAAVGVVGAGTALGGLGAIVGKVGFDFISMKQQAEIAFATMLKDGDKAKAFLGDLQKFAASTPFEFPELVSASQKMLAMGFAADKVVPTLTAIGDAVAGLGGSGEMVDRVTTAMGQMLAKGKASSEEMMQLTEAGIPAWQMLADKIGVDIPTAMDMVSKGAVSAETAVGALTEGMNTKFGGMMEKQSKTAAGLMSTLKDTFSQAAGTILQESGAFDAISAGLAKIAEVTSSPGFQSGLKDFSEGLGAAARKGAEFVQEVGPPIIRVIGEIVDFVRDNWPAVQTTIENVINAVRPVVEAGFGFIQSKAQEVMAWFDTEWPHIQEAIGHVLDAAEVVIRTFTTVAMALWDQFGDDIISLARIAWDTISGVIDGNIKIITGLIQLVVRLINGDWKGAWDAAKQIVEGAWQIIESLISGYVTSIGTILKGLGQAGLDAGQALVTGMWSGIEKMGGWLKGQITEWAKNTIPGWAQKALGISSPSKVFEEKVGIPIAEGVAAGIIAGGPLVEAAVATMAGNATKAAKLAALAAMSAPGAGVAGVSGGSGAAAALAEMQAGAAAASPSAPVFGGFAGTDPFAQTPALNLGGSVPVSPLDLVSIQAMADAFQGSLGFAGPGTGGAMFRDVEWGRYTGGKPTQTAIESQGIRARAEAFAQAIRDAYMAGADDLVLQALDSLKRKGSLPKGLFA